MTEMLCKDCDAIVLFVAPECEEGPDDSSDLMCVLCGAAISFGGMLLVHDATQASAA
jgi:hypothetical protein